MSSDTIRVGVQKSVHVVNNSSHCGVNINVNSPGTTINLNSIPSSSPPSSSSSSSSSSVQLGQSVSAGGVIDLVTDPNHRLMPTSFSISRSQHQQLSNLRCIKTATATAFHPYLLQSPNSSLLPHEIETQRLVLILTCTVDQEMYSNQACFFDEE